MIETIDYNGKKYPAFNAQGNAAQFAIPYAKHVCKGIGLDVGCNREDWKFPGAIPIDPLLTPGWDASNLPDNEEPGANGKWDYIFSSHMVEHFVGSWAWLLAYWQTKLKPGGTLFLYLPHYSQEYWRPWNNTKHVHVLDQNVIRDFLVAKGWKNVLCTGPDMNYSFMVMAENAK